jgi:hypothetical protein
MTSCCSLPVDEKGFLIEIPEEEVQISARAKNACPACGQKGKSVDGATVKSMLSVSLNQIKNSPYYFCQNRDCSTVYFSEDGLQSFDTDEVRERVYQKEPDADDVFVCYCFQHTVGEVLNATPNGHTTILDDINAGIKAQQCACDLRNPQGSCCLGNVRGVIKQAEKSAAVTA